MSLSLGKILFRSAAVGAALGACTGFLLNRAGSDPTGGDPYTALGVYGRPILKGVIASIVIGALGFYAGKGAAIGAIAGVVVTHQKSLILDPALFSVGVVAGGAIGYTASLLS